MSSNRLIQIYTGKTGAGKTYSVMNDEVLDALYFKRHVYYYLSGSKIFAKQVFGYLLRYHKKNHKRVLKEVRENLSEAQENLDRFLSQEHSDPKQIEVAQETLEIFEARLNTLIDWSLSYEEVQSLLHELPVVRGDEETYPHYRFVELEQFEKDSLLVIDEAHELYSSKNTALLKDPDFQAFILKHRHYHLDLVFITQDEAFVSEYIRRMAHYKHAFSREKRIGKRAYKHSVYEGLKNHINTRPRNYKQDVFDCYESQKAGSVAGAVKGSTDFWTLRNLTIVVVLVAFVFFLSIYYAFNRFANAEETFLKPLGQSQVTSSKTSNLQKTQVTENQSVQVPTPIVDQYPDLNPFIKTLSKNNIFCTGELKSIVYSSEFVDTQIVNKLDTEKSVYNYTINVVNPENITLYQTDAKSFARNYNMEFEPLEDYCSFKLIKDDYELFIYQGFNVIQKKQA